MVEDTREVAWLTLRIVSVALIASGVFYTLSLATG